MVTDSRPEMPNPTRRAQNLTQINVAPASTCFPVIATAFVAQGRRSSLFNLRKLEAARLGGLFLVDADLFPRQIGQQIIQ
jgi:hypothetical protein